MKAIASMLTLIALLALLIAPAAAQAGDPAAVVQAYLDAVAAKNLDAALALVADSVSYTDTHPPPGAPALTKGKADFGAFLKGFIDDASYRIEYANVQARGDTVTWTTKEWFDPNNAPPNFPLPIESHLTAVVANGQIASILLENDPTWLEKLYVSIPPEAIDPVSVVQLWARAANAHDLEKMMAYFADDATVTDTHPIPGSRASLKGAADLRALFEKDVKSNARLELSNFVVPEPDHITFIRKYWANPGAFPSNVPFPIESTIDAVIKEGKITSLAINHTPDWLAKLQAAPGVLPATGGEGTSDARGALIVAGVALLICGLVLRRRRTA
jgi:ketosteroid isomerase-like protein